MSDESTIARPYAKALFRQAIETNSLAEWLRILNTLALVLRDPKVVMIIKNPSVLSADKAKFIVSLFDEKNPSLENFVQLLAINKRLLVVPAILDQYAELKHQREKTLSVQIKTFSAMSTTQEISFKEALKKRFQREILLSTSIDPSLLGGAVIYAGDRVIDGSLVSQLGKLKEGLSHV